MKHQDTPPEPLTASERDPSRTPQQKVLELAFSRNRHFRWYEENGAALKSFRRIVQGLLADMRRADPDACIEVHTDAEQGRYCLTVHIQRYGARHRCCVSELEYQALQEHPELGPRLRTHESFTPLSELTNPET